MMIAPSPLSRPGLIGTLGTVVPPVAIVRFAKPMRVTVPPPASVARSIATSAVTVRPAIVTLTPFSAARTNGPAGSTRCTPPKVSSTGAFMLLNWICMPATLKASLSAGTVVVSPTVPPNWPAMPAGMISSAPLPFVRLT